MLKITHHPVGAGGETLQLEGRIAGPWIAELDAQCARLLHAGRTVTLDLAGVSFVEPQGVRLLRRLQQQNVVVTNGSAFVTTQLAYPGA